jgi:lipopolysaccharide export system permease protein
MIIHRAFYRETAQLLLAISAILVVIFLFLGLSVLLGRAARGDLADDVVLTVLGLQTLKRFDLLLVLSLYLGVLLTLSRWYRDSEMTVLAACGVGLPQLLRPVLALALVVAFVVAALGFYFTPLAASTIERVKQESASRPEVHGLAPGVFAESRTGQRIFYIERVDPETGRLENVFVSNLQAGKQGVIVARTGMPFTDARTGDKFIALQAGTAYDGAPGEADYRILEFETLSLRVEPKKIDDPLPTMESLPSGELFRDGTRHAAAEWHWRLSKPIVALVLAVYALVLAYTDTRRGRLTNLFAAILIYFIYSNLLGLGQTLLKKGQVPPGLGLWWVHGGMLLVAAYLFSRRARNLPLLARPGRRP